MNRTFLILLMIGTAMMIAVIGQHEEARQLDTMPWQVDKLENGSLRVFGLTLGKTSIQEANQLFARFGKNQFQIHTDENNHQTFELFTLYNDLTFGGLQASIKLTYQINHPDLEKIYRSLQELDENFDISKTKHKIVVLDINSEIEMKYLSYPISSITYTPSIDYGLDAIRQNFGPAAKEKKINDELQIWSYPKMGLKIYIHQTELDQFIYNQSAD